MATIYRNTYLQWLQKILGLQSSKEQPPSTLAPTVQAIVDIVPRITTVVRRASSATTGGATLYTTPTDKDFYITFVDMAYSKDAANDTTEVYIDCVINGSTTRIMSLNVVAATAQADGKIVSLPYPVLVDRNSVVRIVSNFTAGTLNRQGTVGGYILE